MDRMQLKADVAFYAELCRIGKPIRAEREKQERLRQKEIMATRRKQELKNMPFNIAGITASSASIVSLFITLIPGQSASDYVLFSLITTAGLLVTISKPVRNSFKEP